MSRVFSEADHQRVNQAVQLAESATSAEIVPVIARSSGRYDRAEDIAGLWIAGLSIILSWLLFPLPSVQPGNWEAPSPVWQLIAILSAGLAGFLVGALVSARFTILRRLFTPRVQMQEEADRRAREVFFDKRMHHTESHSGVLLYVSLYEHRAVVLADRSTLDQLGKSQVDDLCRRFTDRLQKGDVVQAICDTVGEVGQRLKAVLPRQENNSNELPDALVVID